MLLPQLGLLLLLLPVCSFAPGFYLVRKLRWNPLEKLCGSIGLSLILLYVVCWAIYCASPRGNRMPVHAAPFFAVSAICLALAAICWRDILGLVRVPSVRRALAGFGFLLLWTALLMAIIRNYSGGTWFGDWLEHFQRTLFFLQHFPAGTRIFPVYALPARPPMMNVLTAYYLAQTADRFELFQAVFAFLNLLFFLPCYLIMPALGRRAKRRTWLLVLLFASSPLLMQNITYSWTKAAAAFYVVLAIWLYLAGWRKRDTVRTTAAFVALAAGLLVHYSAGPYAVILVAHYFLRVFPGRPRKWHELAAIAAICGLFVGTWLVWSMAVYGSEMTFASNTTVTSSKEYQGSTVEKVASNLFDSIVPAILREPSLLSGNASQRTTGAVRDWFFVLYQVNVIFGMGLVGGPVVLWLAFRALRRRRRPKLAERGKRAGGKAPGRPRRAGATPEQWFWLALTVSGVVLGIAVVGERDRLGVAHLALLSLQAIGLSLLAAAIPWRKRQVAMLVLAGCAVDFGFGVLLQARVENLENSPGDTVFPGIVFEGGKIETALPGPQALSRSSWNNWFVKHQLAVYYRWLRELNQRYGQDPAFRAMLPNYQAKINQERADDASVWQGWFARHDGEAQFLGDHVSGGAGIATAALCLLFVGLAGGVFLRTS
jgi:hypothetical protein